MLCKAKVAVCSEIRTKYSTQSEHHVEFLNVKPDGNYSNYSNYSNHKVLKRPKQRKFHCARRLPVAPVLFISNLSGSDPRTHKVTFKVHDSPREYVCLKLMRLKLIKLISN